MGMFDNIKSSYFLGTDFTDVCQTKDLDNTMSFYWISPSRELYLICYDHTSDFEVLSENNPEYDKNNPWKNWKHVPNGNHGKVIPHTITDAISIYPEKYEGKIYPMARLLFVKGKLLDYFIE
jgi:hypothetical protein